jgi:hypothetical protein
MIHEPMSKSRAVPPSVPPAAPDTRGLNAAFWAYRTRALSLDAPADEVVACWRAFQAGVVAGLEAALALAALTRADAEGDA